VLVKLDHKWLEDASPCAPIEARDRSATDRLPTADELDYLLLRLERGVGGGPLDPENRARPTPGWPPLPPGGPPLAPGPPGVVAQYPQNGALKFSLDTKGGLDVNANGTRVRYLTATEYGSSGAPVFDLNWRLIAVNQLRELVFDRPPSYSQGIPISAILARLR